MQNVKIINYVDWYKPQLEQWAIHTYIQLHSSITQESRSLNFYFENECCCFVVNFSELLLLFYICLLFFIIIIIIKIQSQLLVISNQGSAPKINAKLYIPLKSTNPQKFYTFFTLIQGSSVWEFFFNGKNVIISPNMFQII